MRNNTRKETVFIIILAGVCALCALMSGRSGVEAQYIDDKGMTRLEEAAVRENVLAVGFTVTPETQLSKLKEALPGLERVGMLYTEWGRDMESLARDAAGEVGVKLIASPVGKPAEIPVLLKSMNGAVDAFWLMPDPILCDPDVLELILTHSNSYRIPVLSFEKQHVEMGAMMSVGVDYKTVGRKLAEFANAITERGGKIDRDTPVILNEPLVMINQEVVRKFSLTIDKKILDESNKIN